MILKKASKPLFDRDEIIDALTLILEPGQITELRILRAQVNGCYPFTAYGYFDSAEKLADSLGTITAAKGFYITPNPVRPELFRRSPNKLTRAGRGCATQDTDILRRHWLLIDADAKRKGGTGANQQQHEVKVLDGRNLLAACKKVGVEPNTRDLTDQVGDPVASVLSLDLHMRRFTTSRVAMVGAKLALLIKHCEQDANWTKQHRLQICHEAATSMIRMRPDNSQLVRDSTHNLFRNRQAGPA